MIYATLNEQNICIGICHLAGIVTSPRLVPIIDDDPNIIGQQWDGTDFIPAPSETETEA